MKRIKQIIESLRVLSRTPSATIRMAVESVLKAAGGDGHNIYQEAYTAKSDFLLVRNLLDAVVAIAEDMEKPAKPAATETA